MNPFHRAGVSDSPAEALATRLGRLLRLEVELGVAETRDFLRGIGVAAACTCLATIALIASLVMLLAAALSPLFGAPWEPLLIARGGAGLGSGPGLGRDEWLPRL